MKDFIERQMDISDKLFKVMLDDHKERVKDMLVWSEMNHGLMRKLDERDAEITRLKSEIETLKNKA